MDITESVKRGQRMQASRPGFQLETWGHVSYIFLSFSFDLHQSFVCCLCVRNICMIVQTWKMKNLCCSDLRLHCVLKTTQVLIEQSKMRQHKIPVMIFEAQFLPMLRSFPWQNGSTYVIQCCRCHSLMSVGFICSETARQHATPVLLACFSPTDSFLVRPHWCSV